MSDSAPLTVVSPYNAGDAAWMLTSTALVYLMTPGLGFFYGGMVDTKNVVNTLYMSFITMGIVTVQWILVGYSFAFGHGSALFGDFSYGALTKGRDALTDATIMQTNADYSPTYAQYIHVMYQCAFAVITPALISGAVIGRIKFSAYCLFVLLWSTLCYDALAHWMWSPRGWCREMGSVDFAGGNVVHISAGFSALVAAKMLGRRQEEKHRQRGDEIEKEIASPPFIMLGTGLLWVGWMGFNAGSANAASPQAGLALVTTNVAAASAALTWAVLDHMHTARTSLVPACIGAVVGLVTITPAAGYVSPGWAILMGAIGSVVSFYACQMKPKLKIDDSLDVFFCHGVGGVVGGLLTGFFAEKSYNGTVDGAAFQRGILLWYQLAAILATIAWSVTCTAVILLALKYTIGLRVSEEHEEAGMDAAAHGEQWMAAGSIVKEASKIGLGSRTSSNKNLPKATSTTLHGNGMNITSGTSASPKYEAVSMVGLNNSTTHVTSASGAVTANDQVNVLLPPKEDVYATV